MQAMKNIIILLLILFIAGCENFLEEDIRDTQNYDNFFQSEDDLVRMSDGMFGQLIIWRSLVRYCQRSTRHCKQLAEVTKVST